MRSHAQDSTIMISENDASSQLTSNYVLSQATPSTSAATDSARRVSRIRPTIRSFGSNTSTTDNYVIEELSDRPSDIPFSASFPTAPETSMYNVTSPPDNRAIFTANALCIQALLYPITIIIYLLIGAAIFTAIEHDHERMAKVAAGDEIQRAIQAVSRKMNLSENATKEILDNFTYLCTYNHLQTYYAPNQWEFLPSFYFAATVITAIGYGHASPTAESGRAFLCIYALMGIPLLLVSLVTIGKYFTGVWDAILLRISFKRLLMNKHKDILSFGIFTTLGLIGVVFIPAAIFQKIEANWSYKDAVYFAIVSLTTIGFGDFTPAPEHLTELQYVVLYLTWLLIGLAVVSVLVTKMSEIYSRVNKSVVLLSKRYFNKCLRIRRIKKNDYLLANEGNNELNTM